jgi:3-hydroxyisobutyrate dehydrogenase-like beta-hydroxyacid dehydrogenase
MTTHDPATVTVLGLGAMGTALARAVVRAGHATTVWNRTPGRAEETVALGASEARSITTAVESGDLVVACLLDHRSVRETLDPVADRLAGRTLLNLTTTTPNEARELATWASANGVDHLDGGIMAVPAMIGTEGSAVLYSGSAGAFDRHRAVLDLWGTSTYHGADAGAASLYDLAMLTAMYAMFGGFIQGVAMVGSIGVPAPEFAAATAPFLAAMTDGLAAYADVIDRSDYGAPGQQSLEFSDLTKLVRAASEQGVSAVVTESVQQLIRAQIDAGHGSEGFARIHESLRAGRAA